MGKATLLGKTAKADLPATLFGEELHRSLLHEATTADLAARRRGTASTLRRGEVSMTTAKAWRQKGTGRARVGALSSPTRTGGGVAFGPKPRRYTVKVNRKARRRALRSALSVHAERDIMKYGSPHRHVHRRHGARPAGLVFRCGLEVHALLGRLSP